MLFNSIDFLIFFPIVLFIYFVCPKKIRYIWLLVSSYFFYMCWNSWFIFLLVGVTMVSWLCGLGIEWMHGNQHKSKWLVTVSCVILLGTLGYFKYTNFLIGTLNRALKYVHINSISQHDIVLPIGISFFTFQALGYVIDVYRKNVKAEKNVLKYALFVAFFPQLLSGPIGRAKSLLGQIEEEPQHHVWNYERIISGLILMLWGYFLKVVIADRAAILVNQVFGSYEHYQMTALIAGAIAYAIQIYCDFMGYSTIALGAAKVLGFELINNFDTPYLAHSVADFWRRWHISLSTWFRDYLYIPLGGNRKGKWIQYRNILITFAASGLWHGANWTFVIWGLLHGFYQIIEKELSPIVERINGKLHTKTESFGYHFLKVVFTFIFVDFAWIFFRADSISQGVGYISRMFHYRDWWSLFDQSIYTLGLDIQEFHILFLSVLVLLCVDSLRYFYKETLDVFLQKQCLVFRWGVLLVLLFACLIFGCYGPGFESAQFLYLQF